MGQLITNLVSGSRVELEERGNPKSMIYLESNHYGLGEATLIREHLLELQQRALCGESNLADLTFEGCNLDVFCDVIYPSLFSQQVQNCLVNVPIVCNRAIDGADHLVTIKRRGFAPSLTEVGLKSDVNEYYPVDGKAFTYFNSEERRKADYEGKKNTGTFWWLRSADGKSYKAIYLLGGHALPCDASSDSACIRPMFCLNGSVVVSSSTNARGCYTIESFPARGGGTFVKSGGLWVRA